MNYNKLQQEILNIFFKNRNKDMRSHRIDYMVDKEKYIVVIGGVAVYYIPENEMCLNLNRMGNKMDMSFILKKILEKTTEVGTITNEYRKSEDGKTDLLKIKGKDEDIYLNKKIFETHSTKQLQSDG